MGLPLTAQRGFTLIELSIVLVIIGLIVGGVLVGQDLIRAAELRSIITDVEKFKTAAITFRGKYDCLPGDCANASTFFGTDSLGCPAGGGPTGTCNGDGDGTVSYSFMGSGGGEEFRFWQQLALAGLISGNYSGISGPALSDGIDHIIGWNCPASKKSNVGYSIMSAGYVTAGQFSWLYPGAYINEFLIGAQLPGHETGGVALTPGEAVSIDRKMDDGKPGTGVVMAQPSAVSPNCVTGDSTQALTSTYILTTNFPACTLYFFNNF